MIRSYTIGPDGRTAVSEPSADHAAPIRSARWVDLLAPTLEERRMVEEVLGLALPGEEEVEDIAVSSRLYSEDHHLFMTVSAVTGAETPTPTLEPVTFVVGADRLITMRQADSRAFERFAKAVASGEVEAEPQFLVLALVDAITDRCGELLDHVDSVATDISNIVFAPHAGDIDLKGVLLQVGRAQTLTGLIRRSLVSLGRLINFFARHAQAGPAPTLEREIKTQRADIAALSEQAGFLAAQLNFLLDSALGVITLRQNEIIKIFSVMAVLFLPPTLIASIYGMNFASMPELSWPFGYPLALLAMVVAAIAPYLYFRRKGWL